MKKRCRALLLVLVAHLAVLAAPPPAAAASRPPLAGEGGAVVAEERLAAEAGAEILRRGGNAVDAVVATTLALMVVGPEAANLGGGGFAVLRNPDGEVVFLDFRETAPKAARRGMYLDAAGKTIAGASLIGPLATGVPGAPTGYFELHAKHGRLPWAQVVAPARRLAEEGFPLSARTHATLLGEQKLLERFPETAAFWLPDGTPPAIGSVIRQPALARTLSSYAAAGPAAITGGPVGAAILAASAKYGGILTAEDLSGYRPVWRSPLRFEAFGGQLAGPDRPAAGGLLLAGAAGLLERLDYAKAPRFGAERAHLLAESLRRVNADRFLLGDPAASLAKAADLLDPRWLAARLATVKRDRATPSDELALWQPGAAEASETTHISVVDGEGRAVALTTTLNGLYGCGLWVPEAGLFLNNEMDDFATAPGQPNLYGLVQGEANAIAPGKRMLSSQSPTIAWRGDGNEVLALGGRGGSRIPTAVLQILLGVLVSGYTLQAAVYRPRIHHQWKHDRLYHEADALAPETRAALAARGHQLELMPTIAQAHAVRYLREDGKARCEAAPDPRGGGAHGAIARPWP